MCGTSPWKGEAHVRRYMPSCEAQRHWAYALGLLHLLLLFFKLLTLNAKNLLFRVFSSFLIENKIKFTKCAGFFLHIPTSTILSLLYGFFFLYIVRITEKSPPFFCALCLSLIRLLRFSVPWTFKNIVRFLFEKELHSMAFVLPSYDLSSSFYLGFRWPPINRETIDVGGLLVILRDQCTIFRRRDVRVWTLDSSRGFPCDSYFHLLSLFYFVNFY